MKKKTESLRNLFAALGFLVFILIVLSFFLTIFSQDGGLDFSDKVAVVRIEGLIADPTEINRQIREIAERDDVKAVVIRINSPGGGVGPSQEIYREVIRLKDTKKVVASMGAVAASGGYYIASAAHKIVANPGTITGSIGVIVEFMNAEELMKTIGLKGYVIKSGRFKDMGSPLREMNSEENKLIQDVIDDVHSQFVDAVADGRGLNKEDVGKIADGRIFTGSQAKTIGLVDRIGNLADAVDLSGELAGIEGKPRVIYPQRRVISFWRALLNDTTSSILGDFFSGLRVMYLLKNPGT